MVPYVNSPTERTNTGERTEIGRAGELKIYTVVGISFGLLCIIQVIVNISLHRHGGDLEKDQLLLDNEKLNREKNQLSNENTKLIEENMMLKKNITDQRNQISEPQALTRPISSPYVLLSPVLSLYLSRNERSMLSPWMDGNSKSYFLILLSESSEEVTKKKETGTNKSGAQPHAQYIVHLADTHPEPERLRRTNHQQAQKTQSLEILLATGPVVSASASSVSSYCPPMLRRLHHYGASPPRGTNRPPYTRSLVGGGVPGVKRSSAEAETPLLVSVSTRHDAPLPNTRVLAAAPWKVRTQV
ncbi:hypothetical protein Q8A73_007454 [Channa argus]|nr:hypothetical protein Q8A73_007454 [Channa argus]